MLRQVSLLVQHRLDDLARISLAEVLVCKEFFPVFIRAGDDGLTRRLYARDETLGAGVRKILQCRGDLKHPNLAALTVQVRQCSARDNTGAKSVSKVR